MVCAPGEALSFYRSPIRMKGLLVIMWSSWLNNLAHRVQASHCSKSRFTIGVSRVRL